MDEEEGIYRGEVMTIMGILGDINVNIAAIVPYLRGDDDDEWEAQEEDEVHRTPEEKAAQEARYQELLRLIERAKVELAPGERPPPDWKPAPS